MAILIFEGIGFGNIYEREYFSDGFSLSSFIFHFLVIKLQRIYVMCLKKMAYHCGIFGNFQKYSVYIFGI